MSQNVTYDDWVDVDEKWFYVWDNKRRLKILPGRIARRKPIKSSKRHISKVMFLCAVAKPRPEHGFNGLVGIWRVSETTVAKRTSKKRKKGDAYQKDVTMNGTRYAEFMKDKVFAAIREKMLWATCVTVQQDNATPHVKKGNADILKAAGEPPAAGGPRIVTIEQPPRSPDTNVNDLAFFNSLGAKVSKKTKTFDEEELAQIVEDEYNNYPEEKLCDLWKLKRELLHLIFADDGGNNYTVPHGLVHERTSRELSRRNIT